MKNLKNDNFKTYEDYKDLFIVESYIRTKYVDTVVYASDDFIEVTDFMDNNELWDCYSLYYVDDKGNAKYPGF